MALGKLIYPIYFYILLGAGLLIALSRLTLIWRYLSDYLSFISNYLFGNLKYTYNKSLLLIAIIFIIACYFLLAASPPVPPMRCDIIWLN